MVLCEGSYDAGGKTESVLRLHEIFAPLLLPRNLALLTVEKWGVSPNGFDATTFHAHNTRSQRIADHKTVLDALNLSAWDGSLIFIGGSEGGDVMLELLAHYAPKTRAGINFAGAGAHGWHRELWAWIQQQQLLADGSLLTKLMLWWQGVPKTIIEYEKQTTLICADPTPDKWWLGQTYHCLADAFTRVVDLEKIYTCKVPLLVIMGTKDAGIASCDAFVAQAQQSGMPITYWRIDSIGHSVNRDRPTLFGEVVEWLCQNISSDTCVSDKIN